MTTNKPYELDDAFVRAGRISVRVGFTFATKVQSQEIFRRMYVDAPTPGLEGSRGGEKVGESGAGVGMEEIEELAKKFAEMVPEEEYSPADLQDYLLVHKKDPKGAVDGLEAWMVKQTEEKRKKEEEKEDERARRREKKAREEEGWKESIREVVMESRGSRGESDEEAGGKKKQGDDAKEEKKEDDENKNDE
jgi:hypothetical protein